MKLTNEEVAYVNDLTRHPGWAIIERWLTEREKIVTDAVKRDLISCKWEETPKWGIFYSGQMKHSSDFQGFIKQQTEIAHKKLRRKPTEE
jgi:hypothetical protein